MNKLMKQFFLFGVLAFYVMLMCVCVLAGVDGKIQLSPKLTHTGPSELSTPSESLQTIFNWAVTTGTNVNQMSGLFFDQRTITNKETEVLDLYNSLTDHFGTTMNFTNVKFFAIVAASANTGDIVVGGALNSWTNWITLSNTTVRVRAGGAMVFVAPDVTAYPVTDSTGDKLQIYNAGTNSSTYDVYIGGKS